MIKIEPQAGYQTNFLSSPADVVIGGGAAGCFDSKTKILTKTGYKNISEIVIGEYVLSVNLNTRKSEFRKVLNTFKFKLSEIKQRIISFDYKNTNIITTENHEFYITGNWDKISSIANGKMGIYKEHKQEIFNFNRGPINDIELEKFRQCPNNENCKRRKWIFKNSYKDKRQIFNNKDSQNSSTNIYRKYIQQTGSKSYKQKKSRQQSNKSRMVYFKRKLSPFKRQHERIYLKKSTEKQAKRIKNRNFFIKRTSSFRNKKKVQAECLYKENACQRIWCNSISNKRHSYKKKLGAFEINPTLIKNVKYSIKEQLVYDLTIEHNNNYCITEENILVHNSGKTFSLLLETLRYTHIPEFGAVIFRRTSPQITSEGGLWDESTRLYLPLGAKPNTTPHHKWIFKSGAKIGFHHLQHEKNVHDWQGSQIPLIGFDEVTHFTKKQFLYMLSRNRSMIGVKPYVRATCNPDPDSFVAEMIDWAINDEGYIKKEMDNKIRYFSMYEDQFIWGDTKMQVIEKSPHLATHDEESKNLVKSFAFIEGDITDNKKLLEADPAYLANLQALPEEDKLRLLHKNWKVRTDKNVIVDYDMFNNTFSNTFVQDGTKYITCDIATEGKDCLLIWVFSGRKIIDIDIIDKNSGYEALQRIEAMKNRHGVMNSNISFDASGVGGGLTGFISNAKEFKSNRNPIGINKYKNLKAQCAYEFSYSVNQNATMQKTEKHLYYMVPEVANKIYPYSSPSIYKGKTIKWILNHQLKVLRRKNMNDGAIDLINKEEMKALLGGISPDFIESLIQREIFDLKHNNSIPIIYT